MGKGVKIQFHMDRELWQAWESASRTVNMSAEELLRVVVVNYGCEWYEHEPDVIGAFGLGDRESNIPTWALERLASIGGNLGKEFEERYIGQKGGKD